MGNRAFHCSLSILLVTISLFANLYYVNSSSPANNKLDELEMIDHSLQNPEKDLSFLITLLQSISNQDSTDNTLLQCITANDFGKTLLHLFEKMEESEEGIDMLDIEEVKGEMKRMSDCVKSNFGSGSEKQLLEVLKKITSDTERTKDSDLNPLSDPVNPHKASGYKGYSSNFRFLQGTNEADTKAGNNLSNQIPKVSEQNMGSVVVIVIALFISVPLIVIGVLKLVKRRKQQQLDKQQLKVEKLKFLPRVAIPSEAIFSESKSGLNNIKARKGMKGLKLEKDTSNILSPSHRTTHGLKLEENHQSAVINENIFTNIDNSPKSLDDDSPTSSVRNTPKDINFNIEFSMIEQESKIKSARDE